MPIAQSRTIKIMYSQHLCIGTIEAPTISNNALGGTFSPTNHYKKYEQIFLSLEQAANNLLFTHADQIERKIQTLGFYATGPDNISIPIDNLQIMEGEIYFQIENQEQKDQWQI
ncbi:hypothetical protein PPUJ20028_41040 [Pseudomonas putida]|uniref:Uncharacterized protein n=1 Tax=Pseudomonas putida TaxID=303 RepID=A0AA37VNL0_PSEPU|nr:hypothetical protein [Pseudomonas putida]GLO15519.1 hypothetical protein PPUJ20028_41040 [Pseudomonas putida]GLO37051.1 hypothetical protein PPUN14671_38870 [Pseudomonas putida]HDS0965425.1 hypothetical protein [Pseudomonas putida]HDS0992687.1 hypothetical protein [Pseudomonas putida]